TTKVETFIDDSFLYRARPVTFIVNNHSFDLTPRMLSESARFLGVWINLSLKNTFVHEQVKSEVASACRIMRRKHLTDKQLRYVFNRVISLLIEYHTQLTIFSVKNCITLFAPIRKLFKNKLGLSSTSPNY